jgi:hypothetical protein
MSTMAMTMAKIQGRIFKAQSTLRLSPTPAHAYDLLYQYHHLAKQKITKLELDLDAERSKNSKLHQEGKTEQLARCKFLEGRVLALSRKKKLAIT